MNNTQTYHQPVLLQPAVNGLNIEPDGIYVDVTFGGGGHSKEILKHLDKNGKLIAFDQDQDALANTIDDSRFVLINENFRHIKRFLRFHEIRQVDGILADLGVSSHQINVAERGFSTRFDADLDMRMNQRNSLSAFEVVNQYEEKHLRRIFLEYGELKNAIKIAYTIVNERKNQPIKNSKQVKEILEKFIPPHKSNKILAQIYQSIRIEVNQEIEVLKEFLLQCVDLLKPTGRLSIISYHSLEDRLVKRFIRNGIFEGEPERDFFGNYNVPFRIIEKLVVPTEQEIEQNNRARSAKLRIAEKI